MPPIRQLVLDDGRGRGGDQRRKNGVAHGDDGGLDKECPAKPPVGQIEHGQVYQQVQKARQIKRQRQPHPCHQQGADDLTQAVGAAGVEALRHDEQIDGRGHQRRTKDTAQKTKAFFMEQPIINGQGVLPPLM